MFNLEEYVNLPNFLKFLGVAAVVASAFFGDLAVRIFDFLGLGLFAAGYFYSKIYR